MKLLVVGLDGTTAFSGLQPYESVNLQKSSAYFNQNHPACFLHVIIYRHILSNAHTLAAEHPKHFCTLRQRMK